MKLDKSSFIYPFGMKVEEEPRFLLNLHHEEKRRSKLLPFSSRWKRKTTGLLFHRGMRFERITDPLKSHSC
jgi:hypothetical protein